MNTRNRNRLFVTLFLLFVVGFTCLMTFYAGPRMMELRDEVDHRAILYKCQRILDGSTLEVQLRKWRRSEDPPMVRVRMAGLDAPPLAPADDPELTAWAESRGLEPAFASEMAEAAHRTLLAFIRKQNLLLVRADGRELTEDLPPDTWVHVHVSGTDVNRKQLLSGLAFHREAPPHRKPDSYRKAQAEAREDNRGLWRGL